MDFVCNFFFQSYKILQPFAPIHICSGCRPYQHYGHDITIEVSIPILMESETYTANVYV